MDEKEGGLGAEMTEQGEILKGWSQIGAALQVHRQTAKKYAKAYGLPIHYYPSGTVFILRSELRDWLRRRPEDKPAA